MTAESTCDNAMLKIVLCEEDDNASTPLDRCSVGDVDRSPKKSSDRSDGRAYSSRMAASVRKPNSVRSANYVLAPNPYQRRATGCAQCQSMQNSKSNVGPFTQKIMSAKLLRFKQMQNQISEMSLKMAELTAENKTLKTLQRRQDNALKKYEGSREQLPQLIKSHNEEVRVINMKFKQLKVTHKELENKLKQRDAELTNLREQHSHLLELSRDRHLYDREKLTKKLAAMEQYSKEQNERIVTLMRKLELQEKNFKHQLQIEMQKHRETQTQLQAARQMNSTIRMCVEAKDKALSPHKRDFTHETHGYRSRASLPSPARAIVIENSRMTKSDMDSKSCRFSENQDDAETDSGGEDRSNIKVSIKKTKPFSRRKPPKPSTAAVDSPLSPKIEVSPQHMQTNSSDNKSNRSVSKLAQGSGGSLSGHLSTTIDLSEAILNSASEVRNQNASDGGISPRSTSQNFRGGGISIPSDLKIGNAARLRKTAFAEDDVSHSDESDFSEEERQYNHADYDSEENKAIHQDNDDNKITISEALDARARTEQDIDRIISKACDQMLALDDDPTSIVNGIEHFSLSEELTNLKELSWDELNKKLSPVRGEIEKKMEKNLPPTDYSLDSQEKSHLLRALNMIDEDTQKKEQFLENDSFSPKNEGDIVGGGRQQSVRKMFAQNRKKADLMKSLFGSEGDGLSIPEGIN